MATFVYNLGMKKKLNMDRKKRITLGKLISKETTFFEVEKKRDGTIVLYPKTDLPEIETWIYKNKKALKALKSGIKNIKKGLVTKINDDFWAGV